MTRLLEILISFAIVAALFVVVGIFLPSSRQLAEQVETNRKPTIVFDTLNSFRRFKEWNPLPLRDPTAKFELSGPASGEGATMTYTSKEEALAVFKREDYLGQRVAGRFRGGGQIGG